MGKRLLIGAVVCALVVVACSIAAAIGPREVAAAAPPPSPAVELIDVKLDKPHGTATILVHVPGPGTLTLAGGRVVGRSVETSGAGIAKLKVSSKGGALRRLIRSGEVEVGVTVEFVATEGARTFVRRQITLRRSHAL